MIIFYIIGIFILISILWALLKNWITILIYAVIIGAVVIGVICIYQLIANGEVTLFKSLNLIKSLI